ncbi:DUF7553 family protein [Haladaptatus sp. NG-SE-30]
MTTNWNTSQESDEPDNKAEQFNEIEEKLRELMDETSDRVENQLGNAHNELDAYRRNHDFA